jgi:hypothetical protein
MKKLIVTDPVWICGSDLTSGTSDEKRECMGCDTQVKRIPDGDILRDASQIKVVIGIHRHLTPGYCSMGIVGNNSWRE